jgi:DNA-binding CsgD family transcriptional regulator
LDAVSEAKPALKVRKKRVAPAKVGWVSVQARIAPATPATLHETERAQLGALTQPVFVLCEESILSPANESARAWLEKRLSVSPSVFSLPEKTAPAFDRAIRSWGLSKRQAAVFRFVGVGLSNLAVAKELGISERTVEVHVSAILLRARAATRTELVVLAHALQDPR